MPSAAKAARLETRQNKHKADVRCFLYAIRSDEDRDEETYGIWHLVDDTGGQAWLMLFRDTGAAGFHGRRQPIELIPTL